jgi:chromosome segregation ATPase
MAVCLQPLHQVQQLYSYMQRLLSDRAAVEQQLRVLQQQRTELQLQLAGAAEEQAGLQQAVAGLRQEQGELLALLPQLAEEAAATQQQLPQLQAQKEALLAELGDLQGQVEQLLQVVGGMQQQSQQTQQQPAWGGPLSGPTSSSSSPEVVREAVMGTEELQQQVATLESRMAEAIAHQQRVSEVPACCCSCCYLLAAAVWCHISALNGYGSGTYAEPKSA